LVVVLGLYKALHVIIKNWKMNVLEQTGWANLKVCQNISDEALLCQKDITMVDNGK